MFTKENQRDKIKDYLTRHPEGITVYEAFVHLKITKLSTRIGEIVREGGFPIRKVMEYKIKDDGSVEHYMRYWKAGAYNAKQDS